MLFRHHIGNSEFFAPPTTLILKFSESDHPGQGNAKSRNILKRSALRAVVTGRQLATTSLYLVLFSAGQNRWIQPQNCLQFHRRAVFPLEISLRNCLADLYPHRPHAVRGLVSVPGCPPLGSGSTQPLTGSNDWVIRFGVFPLSKSDPPRFLFSRASLSSLQWRRF